MKGGIITALFAARIVKEAGNNMPLKIIFVGDEEIGHTGSYAAQLLEEEAKTPDAHSTWRPAL